MTQETSARSTSLASAWRVTAISFVVTLLVWMVCAWPLPRHLATAVPHATARPAAVSTSIDPMEPGDHLQLLYHFWLFRDMLAGGTPWFGNVYEFNLGNDAERREPGAYYFPFSLFFAVGDAVAGRAFGWNLASFCSLWLTVALTWLLARRMEVPSRGAWLLAAFAICLPYRWHQLAGGSPTGFSMCWPPLLMLGLDLAVRKGRAIGGVLAGLALLFAGWDDTHTLFFGALLCPVWCLICFVRREDFVWSSRDAWLRLIAALVPVLIALFLTVLTTKNMTGNVDKSAMPGRTPHEVKLSSPGPAGLLYWAELGISNQVYFGWIVVTLCAVGAAVVLLHLRRDRRQFRPALALLLVAVAIAGVVALSLGFRGWHDGFAIRMARKLIPPYAMIRQPAKIFILLPSLLVVFFGLSWRSAMALLPGSRLLCRIGGAAILLAMVEYAAQFRVQLSGLRDAPAYAAVASDAAARKVSPHALVIPFWPGDSHYTSVYQYLASMHRIRMVNGYRPFVPKSYRVDLFQRISPINAGKVSEEILAELRKMGVGYLILHEDLFPEKVSPRPVGFTLKQLLNHPQLELVAHEGTVWSWRVLDAPREVKPLGTDWNIWFPNSRIAADEIDPFTTGALQLNPGQSIRLPAPLFFHRGSIDPAGNRITVDPVQDKTGILMYGPRLPIRPGAYELSVDYTAATNAGTLGTWHVECPERTLVTQAVMQAGAPFLCSFTSATGGVLQLVFTHESAAPYSVDAVTLRRTK